MGRIRLFLLLLLPVVLTGCSDVDVSVVNQEIQSETVSEDELSSADAESAKNLIIGEESDTDNSSKDRDAGGNEETVSFEEPESAEQVIEESSDAVVVSEDSESASFTTDDADMILYACKNVNVRSLPDTGSKRIGALNIGDEVHVSGSVDGKWYRFEFEGETAYVSSSYLITKDEYDSRFPSDSGEKLSSEENTSEENPPGIGNPEENASEDISFTDVSSRVVELMNEQRTAAGVNAVAESAELDRLAMIRAEEIVTSFSHTRPDGSMCFTILEQNGVIYVSAGENIAAGQSTPETVMTDWMNSDGHRSNILNPSFGHVGIGCFKSDDSYGTYWVQLFTD